MNESTVCQPREHIFKRGECGHVWCQDCHPEVLDGSVSCAHCDDAFDVIDELLDDVEP